MTSSRLLASTAANLERLIHVRTYYSLEGHIPMPICIFRVLQIHIYYCRDIALEHEIAVVIAIACEFIDKKVHGHW